MRIVFIFTVLSVFLTSPVFGAIDEPANGGTGRPRALVVVGAMRASASAPAHGGAGENISSTISRPLEHLVDDLEELVDDASAWLSNIFARMSLRRDGYTAVASEPLAPVLSPVGSVTAVASEPPAPVLSPIGSFTAVASEPPAPVLSPVGSVTAVASEPLAPVLSPVGSFVVLNVIDPTRLAKNHLAWEIREFLVEGLSPPTHAALMELPSALAYASYECNIVRALLPLEYEPTFSDMDNLGIIMTAARFARHHPKDTFIRMFDDRAKFNFPKYRRQFEDLLRHVGIVPKDHIAYNNGAFYLSRPFPRLGGERFEWITATYKEHLQKFCPDIPKPATGAVTSYTCACGKHNS